MGTSGAGGRAAAAAVTLLVILVAAAVMMAPAAHATNDPEQQIEEIAADAMRSMDDREEAFGDYLKTEPSPAAAQAELTVAIADVEADAAAADLAITNIMLLYPLDPGVQAKGTEAKQEVHEKAADVEASMSAAYASYVAGLPLPTTTTTSTATTTSSATTTTTAAPTTTTTVAATTTTAVTTTTAATATASPSTTTATTAAAAAPATTTATVTSGPTTTTPRPAGSQSGPAGGATDESPSEPGSADTSRAGVGSELLEATGDRSLSPPQPQSLAALASQLQTYSQTPAPSEPVGSAAAAPSLDLDGALQFLRVRLPGPVAAPLGDLFTIVQAFGLAFISGIKSVALPTAALGAVTLAQSIVRSPRVGRWGTKRTPVV